MRLYQLIKAQYNLTRSELTDFLSKNIITVNNKLIDNISIKIDNNDIIHINGNVPKFLEIDKQYILYYKPRGVICTNDKMVTNNIMTYFQDKERLFTIGRLDKDSEGLIILTNDGQLFNKIVNGKFHVEKEYEVIVNKIIDDRFISEMANGVKLKDKVTRKCLVKQIDNYKFNIVLTQGLNRQIRKMCMTFGYQVISLKRFRIKNILCDLKLGESRFLTAYEIDDLLR